MAQYLPPTENPPILDTLNFNLGNIPLTYNTAIQYFLTYPYAQGTENLQAINVSGNSTFLNSISMIGTSQANRTINNTNYNLISQDTNLLSGVINANNNDFIYSNTNTNGKHSFYVSNGTNTIRQLYSDYTGTYSLSQLTMNGSTQASRTINNSNYNIYSQDTNTLSGSIYSISNNINIINNTNSATVNIYGYTPGGVLYNITTFDYNGIHSHLPVILDSNVAANRTINTTFYNLYDQILNTYNGRIYSSGVFTFYENAITSGIHSFSVLNASGVQITPLVINAAGGTMTGVLSMTNGTTTNTLSNTTWSGTSNSILTVSDNSSGNYYIPFSKTNAGASTTLYLDDSTTPLNYNPATNVISASATNINTSTDNTNGTYYIPFSKTTAGIGTALFLDDTTGPLTYNPSTGVLSAATFSGTLNGTATLTNNTTLPTTLTTPITGQLGYTFYSTASSTSITTNILNSTTAANLLFTTLGVGVWDISFQGTVIGFSATPALVTNVMFGISTTSTTFTSPSANVLANTSFNGNYNTSTSSVLNGIGIPFLNGNITIVLTAATTLYLNTSAIYTTSTVKFYGYLSATRIA